MSKKKVRRNCLSCGLETKRPQYIYCNNTCQFDFQYRSYISRWKQGLEDGNKGEAVSNHVRRYLIEKYGEKCRKCGWSERHTITGKVPLNIEHKDGNSQNSKEDNLDLLCPNCHSLTSTFGALNKGNGRQARRDKRMRVSLIG